MPIAGNKFCFRFKLGRQIGVRIRPTSEKASNKCIAAGTLCSASVPKASKHQYTTMTLSPQFGCVDRTVYRWMGSSNSKREECVHILLSLSSITTTALHSQIELLKRSHRKYLQVNNKRRLQVWHQWISPPSMQLGILQTRTPYSILHQEMQ